jgi:hypothetical protein
MAKSITVFSAIQSRRRMQTRAAFAWLELLLTLSCIALFMLLFPSLPKAIGKALDVRRWSHIAWLVVNLLAVLSLLAIRFGGSLYSVWRKRRSKYVWRENQRLAAGAVGSDSDLESRRRRDAEWRERARKRLPWH